MKTRTIEAKTGFSGTPAEILARQIMSTDVIWVKPDLPVHEIASLLARLHISAVPVLDNGKIVGIVSEADIIRREELGTIRTDRRNAQDGPRAADVMTRDVVTIGPDTPLREIARLMQSKNIRRLPVVDGRHLAGIVSRADIVRTLAARPDAPHAPLTSDDDILRLAVIDALMRFPGASPWLTSVTVARGVVELDGLVEDETALIPSREAAANLPEVAELHDRRTVLQPY